MQMTPNCSLICNTAVMEHQRQLEACIASLRDWSSSPQLPLNLDKTELIWFSSIANWLKLKQLNTMSFNICSVIVEPVDSVHDFGVIPDSKLSMWEHKQNFINLLFPSSSSMKATSTDLNSMQCLVSAFTLSWVYYCNAVFAGLLASTLAPLEWVLNVAACCVTGSLMLWRVPMSAADRLSDTIHKVCPRAWYELLNQSGIPIRHHYVDLVNVWSSSVLLYDDKRIRHPTQRTKFKDREFSGWTTWMEHSICRFQELVNF